MTMRKVLMMLAAATMVVACGGNKDNPSGGGNTPGGNTPGGETKPEETLLREVKIQVVSTLSATTLFSSDAIASAVKNYVVTTLNGRKGADVTILERTDSKGIVNVNTIAGEAFRNPYFVMSKINAADGTFEGNTVLLDKPSRSFAGTAVSDGCYRSITSVDLNGVASRMDASGKVLGTTPVPMTRTFITGRFDTADQVRAAFPSSVLPAAENVIAVGTVKKSAFSDLQSAIGGNYFVKAVEEGSEYTIFFIGQTRYWEVNGCKATTLRGNVKAYEVSLAACEHEVVVMSK